MNSIEIGEEISCNNILFGNLAKSVKAAILLKDNIKHTKHSIKFDQSNFFEYFFDKIFVNVFPFKIKAPQKENTTLNIISLVGYI